MKVYFISGLGADRRMFRNISLPAGYEIVHVDWLLPEKEETLPHYCRRLLLTLDTTEPFCLAGLSFGGIVAAEMSRIIAPEKLVLFSTIKTRNELPSYYRSAGKARLQKIASVFLVLRNPLAFWLFGVKEKEEKALLREVFSATSPAFLHWSLQKILEWENTAPPARAYHIHGDADKILPVRYTHPDKIIAGGGHLMVLDHAGEVNEVLARLFA